MSNHEQRSWYQARRGFLVALAFFGLVIPRILGDVLPELVPFRGLGWSLVVFLWSLLLVVVAGRGLHPTFRKPIFILILLAISLGVIASAVVSAYNEYMALLVFPVWFLLMITLMLILAAKRRKDTTP